MAVSTGRLLKETWSEFGKDNVARLGAAFAYYTFTSFFPLILVLISLIGIALSLDLAPAEDARQQVLDAVSSALPAAEEVLSQAFADTERNSTTLGLAGLLTGLWAASNIFAQLEQSFNVIFDVVPRDRGILDMLRARGQAAVIVVLIAVLMIGSLILGTILNTVGGLATTLPGGEQLWWLFNLLLSLGLTALVFALLFKFIPDKPVTWPAALMGGVFTSIAWQIGREILTWYLGRSAAGPTAGTVVGSVLAFLILVYYASQILMMGAQLTATYDELANPEKVAPKTSEDSALAGPGRAPVNESGEPMSGTQHASPATFALGFVAGVASLFVAARAVVGRVVGRA